LKKSCNIIPFNTALLPIGTSAHAALHFRGQERHDVVLLQDNAKTTSPWVCLHELFTFSTNSGTSQWALVEELHFENKKKPIHKSTGVPLVVKTQKFVVLPLSAIWQVVHLIPNMQDNDDTFWVNWWISFGEFAYPEQHRWECQQKWGWTADFK